MDDCRPCLPRSDTGEFNTPDRPPPEAERVRPAHLPMCLRRLSADISHCGTRKKRSDRLCVPATDLLYEPSGQTPAFDAGTRRIQCLARCWRIPLRRLAPSVCRSAHRVRSLWRLRSGQIGSLTVSAGISLRVYANPADGLTCFDLLTDLGADMISAIRRLYLDSDRFETCAFTADGETAGVDFTLLPNKVLWIDAVASGEVALDCGQ